MHLDGIGFVGRRFVAAMLFACFSCSSGNDAPSPTGPNNGNPDGGPGSDGGLGGDGPGSDPGGEYQGSIPPPAVINYTCTKEIHVAKTGNDANDGSAATPYLTIAKAALLARAGDCVKVHAGTYAETTT